MTPDAAWRLGEIYDEIGLVVCEIGVVIFILTGIGAGLYNWRVYWRYLRRARFKRNTTVLERKL